jgi:hypothetical protein
MYKVLTSNTISSMAVTADGVVGAVLLQGSGGMQTTPRTEVGFVAAITLGGISGIATAWRPLLGSLGIRLSISGVFCHAAPQIRFERSSGGYATCELADLLVVVDSNESGKVIRNASLIQAKMAAKAARVKLTGASSVRQLGLYQSWPLFSFVEGIYGNNHYDLAMGTTEDAGTFGVIDRHFRNRRAVPPLWTQHAAKPTPGAITNEPSLGNFLAEMAAMRRSGFGRRAVPGGEDDWSKVIDILLRVTYAKTFRHAPTLGAAAPHRGDTTVAYFISGPAQSAARRRAEPGWRPPFDGIEFIEGDAPGGISVVHIMLTQDAEG